MNLWRNTNGNLIVQENGNPILCDDCPCGACASGTLASSYTVQRSDLGPSTFVLTQNYDFLGTMDGCELSDLNQDVNCPYFGAARTAFFDIKIYRATTGAWQSTRDACGGNRLGKNDGLDHPIGTYGSYPLAPYAIVT